jgi:dihydroorotase
VNYIIRQATLINPGCEPEMRDIAVADGVIVGLDDVNDADATIIDATGLWLIPGMVDMAARLREPGYTYKGTIATETRAAVAGGITCLALPPDTNPVIDNTAVIELVEERARNAGCARVLPLAAATAGLEGQLLAPVGVMKKEGVVGVSNAMSPYASAAVLRQVMKYASTLNLPLHIQPIDYSLCHAGGAHEGDISTRLGLPPIPSVCETIALGEILTLAEELGARVHIGRISTARAVAMIADAKQRGIAVSCDVAVHQLFYTDADIGWFDANFHVMPPLRTAHDRQVLREGVKTGVIDAICSDHQPHDIDAKSVPFPETEPGISTLDSFASLLMRLCEEEQWTLSSILATVTTNPANILGQKTGVIAVGKAAELVLINPDVSWRLGRKAMYSKGKNTPLMRKALTGRVEWVMMDGNVVFER